MYKVENAPSRKATFAKIYLGDYLHYLRGIIPQEYVEIKTKQINGKFCLCHIRVRVRNNPH